MDTIEFPSWVRLSPAFAFARVLGHHLREQATHAVTVGDANVTAARDSDGVGREGICVALTGPEGERVARLDGQRSCFGHDLPLDMGCAGSRKAPVVGESFATEMSRAAKLGTNLCSTGFSGDVMSHPRVAQLFKMSQAEGLIAKRACISGKNAPILIALMALAVDCRSLRFDCTRSFYKGCASLYVSLMEQLHTTTFTSGLDVQGFVSSLVCCGVRLRHAPGSGRERLVQWTSSAFCAASADTQKNSDDGSTEESGGPSVGLGAQIVDSLIIQCIPSNVVDCVGNAITLGALQGITVAREAGDVYLGAELIEHLHNLGDALAASSLLVEAPYKRLLCFLLEVLSAARGVCYNRLRHWCPTVLQPTCVLRGLQRSEDSPARLIAATLSLLVVWLRQTSMSFVAANSAAAPRGGNVGLPLRSSISEFVNRSEVLEAKTLLDGVWGLLLDYAGECTRAKECEAVLYGDNLCTVVGNLLRAELEFIQCYVMVNDACCGDQRAVGGRRRSSATEAKFVLSAEEDAARLRVVTNVIKFLLLPTSAFAGFVASGALSLLQQDLAEQCAKVLATVVSTDARVSFLSARFSPSVATRGRSFQFSNRFYGDTENIIRELIRRILRAGKLGTAACFVETGSRVAALCLQGLCATNTYIRALASTEVNDTVTQSRELRWPRDDSDWRDDNSERGCPQTFSDTSLRLSVCFEMMNRILVSRHCSLCKPLPCEDLCRFTQLLFDTFEDALRTRPWRGGISRETRRFPTDELRVAADAFGHLVERCRDRLLAMMRQAFGDDPHGKAGGAHNELGGLHAVRALNGEAKVLSLLMRSMLRCMINCLWPGSGIIYGPSIDGIGEELSDGNECGDVCEMALAIISLFLQPLCLLCQLLALLPVKDVQRLKTYHDEVQRAARIGCVDSLLYPCGFETGDRGPPIYEESDAVQLRSYWLMLTYYGFTSWVTPLTPTEGHGPAAVAPVKHPYGGEHKLSWKQARCVRFLASLLPPLMRMRSTDYQQIMSDIEVLGRHLGAHRAKRRAIKPCKRELLQYLTECCPDVSCVGQRLEFPELFLFHSLATLEVLRASYGSICTIAQYHRFEICEFDASTDFRAATACLTTAVTTRYLSVLRDISPEAASKRIDADVPRLVLLYGFAVQSVRRSAQEILEKIILAFSSFAGVSKALPHLWDIIGILERGSAAEVEVYCKKMQLQEPPVVAADPRSPERRRHVDEAISFAAHWAQLVQQAFPIALSEHAARFVVDQPVVSATTRGVDFRLTPAAHDAVVTLPAIRQMCEQGLMKRSDAKGHVRALSRTTPDGNVGCLLLQRLREAGENLVRAFGVSEQLRVLRFAALSGLLPVEIGTQGATNDGGCGRERRAEERIATASKCSSPSWQCVIDKFHESDALICSAAELLTTARITCSTKINLLWSIVQYPIRSFSNIALANAINCWRWILFEKPEDCAVPLLVQIVEGFLWTMTHRIGLFDASRPEGIESVESGDRLMLRRTALVYSQDYSVNSPHKLLFEFLISCYLCEGGPVSFAPPVLSVLRQFAMRIVKGPLRLSTRDLAFSEMMRCVLTVGFICRNLQRANECRLREGSPIMFSALSVGALRQGWYRCLLQWFRKTPPSWYFPQNPMAAEGELAIMEELMGVLDRDLEALSRSSDGFLDFALSGQPGDPTVVNLSLMGSAARRRVGGGVSAHAPVVGEHPIIVETGRLVRLLKLLKLLVKHEHHRLLIWLHPCESLSMPSRKYFDSISQAGWLTHCTAAAENDPAVLVALVARFPSACVVGWAAQIVAKNPEVYSAIPGAIDLYLNKETLLNGYPALHLFRDGGVVQSLRYLHPLYASRYPQVTAYALRSLLSRPCSTLVFYLPQMLQIFSGDQNGSVTSFLVKICRKNQMFAHQLLWSLRAEEDGDSDQARKRSRLALEIRGSLGVSRRAFLDNEFNFIDSVISLSGEMMLVEKPLRKCQLRLRLSDARLHDSISEHRLYLPTDSNCRILALRPDSAGAMQSAAKCPIMVEFECVPQSCDDGNPSEKQGKDRSESKEVISKLCIFKMGDDCRQDQLALQLIGFFQRVFDSMQLPSFLYPYKVVATGRGCGVIECVPHAVSRDQIGKLVEGNLSEYFVQTYGHPESVSFRRARDCFIRSMASYAMVSFVLNVKDRHNGNILIDSQGHLVHIDFGFLFDFSPGGDINFESSPFKLTLEMAQLMGYPVKGAKGRQPGPSLAKALVDLESYNLFVELTIHCFLSVRQYAQEICILVELMLDSGLPCFKSKRTIHDLAWRLAIHKSEAQAAHFMRKRIMESRGNVRTVLYDRYQNYAEGIEM